MPTDVETSFNIWWRGLDPSVELEVRYPHSRHGNAGRTSNSAKTTDFLEFVDINSQPKQILVAPHIIFCQSSPPSRRQKMVYLTMKNVCSDLLSGNSTVHNVREVGVGVQTGPLTIGSNSDQR